MCSGSAVLSAAVKCIRGSVKLWAIRLIGYCAIYNTPLPVSKAPLSSPSGNRAVQWPTPRQTRRPPVPLSPPMATRGTRSHSIRSRARVVSTLTCTVASHPTRLSVGVAVNMSHGLLFSVSGVIDVSCAGMVSSDIPHGTDRPYPIRILAFFEMIRPYTDFRQLMGGKL